MLLSPSAGASPQPDYATDAIALLGDAAPAPAPPEDATAAPIPAAPMSLPLSSTGDPQTPESANASAGQDVVFAGMGDAAFADPLGGAPAPSSPSLASPPAPGGGSGGGASPSAYVAPMMPTSGGGTPAAPPSMPMTPMIPPSYSYPSMPGMIGMPGMTPSAPPTWVNGAPSFHWAAPTAPAVDAIGPQANAEGASVSLQVHAVGTNAVELTSNYPGLLNYDAVGLPAGLTINHNSGLILGTIDYRAAEAFGGVYKPTVVVADSVGGQNAQTFTWTVADTVRPPAFTTALIDQTNNKGDTVSLQANAAQPDGDQLIYDDNGTLPSGLTIDSLSGAISGTIADDAAASYHVTITATDNTPLDDTPPGKPLTASESFTWSVGVLHDPTLSAPPSQVNAANDPVSLTVQGDDAPGNTLTYSATNLPDGLSIDPANGVLSGTVQADAARSAPYDVTATVSDGTYQTSEDFSWTVNAVGVANPGDQGNQVGDAATLAITGNEAGLTYSAWDLPPGLTIDPSSGAITGTILPTADTYNPYSVTVMATDGQHSGSTTFAWDVSPWAPADRTDVEGAAVSFAGAALSTNSYLSYSATGLPGGVGIDPNTGLISGTLTRGDAAAGPYAVTVTTTTTSLMGSYSTAQGFTWTVTPVVDVPPTLTDPGDQISVAGIAVSLAPSATDVDGTEPTYSATGLPDGLNIDPDSGVISGVPAEDVIQSAPSIVTVTMEDGDGGSTTQTFDWTVNDSTLSVQGNAIGQVAGAGVDTFNVATFTDPDLNRQASDYAATINWGDGQTSAGTVAGANGVYTVSGDHVYLHPGGFPVQVTVTDLAGETATSTATASVTPAPLLVTGNLMDGATSGLATTFTVATFTDANGYAAAGDFTATVHWGDGSTTTGALDGGDGVFRVTGAHTYASDGTYTVGVTVTDADGVTATATSTVTAGDLQAGLNNTLTVASFTSADPNATASDFTAMIQWGDSGFPMEQAGMVLQEGNQFVVVAAHAFTTAEACAVQVTITDRSGDQLSGSETVQVAPAPAPGYGGEVAAENGYVMDGPLALFTLPQGYGSYGSYTATADWGDGTSSSVSLDNNGDIWEALGDHGYAGPGQYAVRTLVYNAALQVVAAAVTLVEADAPAKIVGPAVVPGNSVYQYQVAITPTALGKIKKDFPTTDDGFSVSGGGSRVRSGFHQNSAGLVDYFWADIQFDNMPAVVNVTMAKWLQGTSGIAATLPVVVVQVIVKQLVVNDPPFKATPTKPLEGPADSRKISIDGNPSTGNTSVPIYSADASLPNVANPEVALKFEAEVYLKGPSAGPDDAKGLKGVDHITVGLIQHLTVVSYQVHFPSVNESLVYKFANNQKTFLDALTQPGAPPGPFYDNGERAVATDTNAVDGKVIQTRDTPGLNFPVILLAPRRNAKELIGKMSFQLDVAAATNDAPAQGDNRQPTAIEATAAPWTFTASGTLENGIYTPAETAGVKAPNPNKWTIAATPVMENMAGPLYNFAIGATGVGATGTWVTTPDKPGG